MYNQYNRKYPKVTGWWVYVIKTPNDMYYPGYSGGKDGNKQCWQRWNQNSYKETALSPYIEEFGWDNLEKIVVVDGLTEDEAVKWEGKLINLYRSIGRCINILGSHWKCKYDKVAYKKEWHKEHKDRVSEQHRKQYQEHCEEIKEKSRLYRQEHRVEVKEKQTQYRSMIEWKIYRRVYDYNRIHTPIETPQEAKRKYLESGYIPDYIKSNDLF